VKRPYETVIVFDGTLPDDVLAKEQAQIEEIIKQSATFTKTDVWGKRTLAYPIRKKRLGYYCLFLYEAEGTFISTLERSLKLNERALRFLSVVQDPRVEAARAAFVARKEKAMEAPQPKPAADGSDEEEVRDE
jgi:small subunit ribosomal protein S6